MSLNIAKRRSEVAGVRWISKADQITLDFSVLLSAFVLSYLLRFDFNIPKHEALHGCIQLPFVVLIQLLILQRTGVYSFVSRYVSMNEVRVFSRAALWSFLPLLVFRLCLPAQFAVWKIPFSIIIADTFIAFVGVLGLRVVRRINYEQSETRQIEEEAQSQKKRPVILVGAGRAGVLAAKEIQRKGGTGLEIKGFVDDNPDLQGSVLSGVKVLGTTKDLPRLVSDLQIDHVVISIAAASRRDFRRILDICEQIPVKVRVIPSMHEILEGKLKVTRIRDVQIEDLLGREPVTLIQEDMQRLLAGKQIIVTGAGGSIGSELVRQVAQHNPAMLLLVERCEFALFNIEREMRQMRPDLKIVPLIADVGDEPRMRQIFDSYMPHVVIHAAAHKHVPMMEINAGEAVRNNVLATRLLGELAGEFGVEAFVLISTDKAVRPTSVMGATKRISELVIQDLNNEYVTRYVAVRFGNVIGSTGSVIPIFHDQVRMGGPVTVTHPDMIRYFMTIPEAAQLVLQAAAIGEGGEIFILDMGSPVRILDVAKRVISLCGLKPFEDIDIVFTGIRPGEKLFEELEITEEQMTQTRHPKIFIGKITSYPKDKVRHALRRLDFLSRSGNDEEIRRFIANLLPESQLKVQNVELSRGGKGIAFPRLRPVHAAISQRAEFGLSHGDLLNKH